MRAVSSLSLGRNGKPPSLAREACGFSCARWLVSSQRRLTNPHRAQRKRMDRRRQGIVVHSRSDESKIEGDTSFVWRVRRLKRLPRKAIGHAHEGMHDAAKEAAYENVRTMGVVMHSVDVGGIDEGNVATMEWPTAVLGGGRVRCGERISSREGASSDVFSLSHGRWPGCEPAKDDSGRALIPHWALRVILQQSLAP